VIQLNKIALVTCGMLLALSTAHADTPKANALRRYVGTTADDKRPFSPAVMVKDTLYVAGHLGLDKAGAVPADVKVEIKTVLDNLKQTIETAGLKMDDLVSVQVFCTDLTLFDTFNEIYRGYFHGHFPARAFLGTGSLLRGAHFEVMGIAVKDIQ
jgi:2-iminobutanoate/2-iminopropanoate deaminase